MSERPLEVLERALAADPSDADAWVELAVRVARGAPLAAAFRTRGALAAVLLELWRTPERRELAGLALELMDLDPWDQPPQPAEFWRRTGRLAGMPDQPHDAWSGLPLAARLRPSGIEVRLVPPDDFLQGDLELDELEGEEVGAPPADWPRHAVRLPGCWMAPAPLAALAPEVRWEDAAAAARAAGGRLPRESEWEYVADAVPDLVPIPDQEDGVRGEFCRDVFGPYLLAAPEPWEGPPIGEERVWRDRARGPGTRRARRGVATDAPQPGGAGRVARDLVPPGLTGEGPVPIPRHGYPALEPVPPTWVAAPRDPHEAARPLLAPRGLACPGARLLAYSPDGRHLALGPPDGEVALVTMPDERPVALPGLRFPLVFSPSGACLAAACEDGLVRVVELASLRVLAAHRLRTGRPRGLAFPEEGVLAVLAEGALHRVSLASGAVRSRPLHGPGWGGPGWRGHAVLTPDARRLLLQEPSRLRLEDLETGSSRLVCPDDPPLPGALPSALRCLALSPDGSQWVASFSQGEDGAVPGTTVIHEGDLGEATVAADLAAGADFVAHAWDHRDLVVLRGDEASWIQRGGRTPRALYRVPGGRLVAAAFAPDGSEVALLAEGGAVHRWPREGPASPPRPRHGGVRALAASASAGLVAVAGVAGAVEVCRLATGDPAYTLGDPDERCRHLRFSADGRWLGAAFEGGRVRVVRAADGTLAHDFSSRDLRLSTLVFWPHWEPERGYRVHTLGRHFRQFLAEEPGFVQDCGIPPAFADTDLAAASEGGARVALGGPWPRIPLFDLPRGLKIGELTIPGAAARPRLLALAEQGDLAVAVVGRCRVCLWGSRHGPPDRVGTPARGGDVTGLAVSESRREVALGLASGLVQLRGVEDWRLRGTLEGHHGPVRALVYADAVTLLTGADDECLRVRPLGAP